MLLTLSATPAPARDLGYLLHKHPDRVQEFTQSFGAASATPGARAASPCASTASGWSR
ncbi:hypothetical protein [Nocardioides sp. T2.26MG-1]|uniref:hypothetical protein n=1 Tax=Nocardioides sp. T2.26MG-1 TaxID=3041166 RepID=UPI002541AF3F|nr:hypothetical protein [Nocardioides sp. T2.26MG-1]